MRFGSVRQIRVLVADDHGLVRAGIRSFLERDSTLQVVAEAATGHSTVDAWERHRPDVMLLDLRMPQGDGLWVVRHVRRRDPHARFIILTTFEGDEAVHRALEAGARGYMLKDATPNELVAAIHEVARGGSYISPELARQLAGRAPGERLTPREIDVLMLLARGAPNKTIAETLGIVEGTVKLHVRSILGKLGATSRSEALVIAAQRGFTGPSD